MKKILISTLCILLAANLALALSGKQVHEEYNKQNHAMEKSVTNLFMIQEMTSMEEGAEIKAEIKIYRKGIKTRTETRIISGNLPMGMDGDTITIDDGENTWFFHPMLGMQKESGESANKEQPVVVRSLGSEKIENTVCHVIETHNSMGEKTILWIDKKDYTLIKEESVDGEDITTTIFNDHEKIKGYRFPVMTKTYENGNLVATSVLKNVNTEESIPDSLFNPEKVSGYDKKPVFSAENTGQMDLTVKLMDMQMKIQELYMKGENEKAGALEKELEEMMKQFEQQ